MENNLEKLESRTKTPEVLKPTGNWEKGLELGKELGEEWVKNGPGTGETG